MSMNTPVESLLVIEEPPIPSVQYIQDANAVEKEKKKSRKPSKSTRIKRKPLTDYKLITSTGRPKSENGIYVQEEEKKMNESEKVACFIYVERECKKEKRFEKFSNRQKKRFCFQKRLIFLLNKSLMMRIFQSNNSKEAAKNKKKAVNQDYPMISGNSQKSQNYETKNSKFSGSVRKPNFDICYNENNGENDVLNLSGNHGFGENNEVPARFTSSGGYQSIADDGQDVFNPWLSAAATVPQDYISFRDSTFDISANFRQPAEYSSFDSCSLPPPISTASTNYDECLAPLLPVTNIDSFQSSYNSVHPNVISPIPTSGYVSMYRQQFPSQNLEMANNLNMIRFNSPPPLDLLFQSVDKQSKLEESEEELARAKRLIEIEKELNIINEKKAHMQIEEEIRQRELEIAQRRAIMDMRERELRDREFFEIGRRSLDPHFSGQHYDARKYHDYSHHYGRDDYSDSFPISIERRHADASSASRRHGQRSDFNKSLGGREMHRGEGGTGRGEGSLKLWDDPRSRIQETIKPAKRPRHRNWKGRIEIGASDDYED